MKNIFYKLEFDADFLSKKGFCSISDLCLIEGEEKFILIEKDCCHTIYDNQDIITFNLREKKQTLDGSIHISMIPTHHIELSKDDIFYSEYINISEINDISQFIDYFGIKSRVYDNYKILKNSLKKCLINVSLPKWK